MESCVFCRIVAGELPASVVFEDELVMAFMDIQPVTEGHTLLIPKPHWPNIGDLNAATTAHLTGVARRLTAALYSAFGCAGLNWFVADGAAAGQEVLHMHLHLIPRNPGDGFGLRLPPDYKELPPREALDRAAAAISGALAAPETASHLPAPRG